MRTNLKSNGFGLLAATSLSPGIVGVCTSAAEAAPAAPESTTPTDGAGGLRSNQGRSAKVAAGSTTALAAVISPLATTVAAEAARAGSY